jgi:YebC/PmpR family DNA-binding regulatory protein
MAGHSKWHNIRAKKEKMDKRKGKLFSKLSREIMVAIREGGPDPEFNPRLRNAIKRARSAGMSMDTIEKLLKKAKGELDSQNFQEIIYEGYGPGGVAIIVEVVTDNRNRTVAELRRIFQKHGGNLGESGSVTWQFKRRGLFTFPSDADEDKITEIALNYDVEDIKRDPEDGTIEVICEVKDFAHLMDAFEQNDFKPITADITYIPTITVQVEGETAEKLIKLLDALEDHDDVQKVHSNFQMSKELLEKLAEVA